VTTFTAQLKAWQDRSEAELARRLPSEHAIPQWLHQAMRYSVLGGGKRVRPVLVYATGQALGVPLTQLDAAACAIELIHAYSLIHDDLPAMDDDDLRRGRPTCHKAFDEATAILAGDALQVLAFQILACDPTLPADAQYRLRLVQLLAVASGTDGMAGGQALDLAAEGQSIDLQHVELIHDRKTGALIRASVLMPMSCWSLEENVTTRALRQYAQAVGVAFQIQDDLLDIEGDPALMGKAVGADQIHHKPTYPAVAGVAAAKQRVRELHDEALAALTVLGPAADPLRDVSDWLVLRRQ
jgi:geranylgeranyl pyrophosphate synthase